ALAFVDLRQSLLIGAARVADKTQTKNDDQGELGWLAGHGESPWLIRKVAAQVLYILRAATATISALMWKLNLVVGTGFGFFRAAEAQRGLLHRHRGIRIHAVRQPDVGADHRVMADHGVAAQDGGVGIDNHVVLQGRMAFLAADNVSG